MQSTYQSPMWVICSHEETTKTWATWVVSAATNRLHLHRSEMDKRLHCLFQHSDQRTHLPPLPLFCFFLFQFYPGHIQTNPLKQKCNHFSRSSKIMNFYYWNYWKVELGAVKMAHCIKTFATKPDKTHCGTYTNMSALVCTHRTHTHRSHTHGHTYTHRAQHTKLIKF